MVTTWRWGLIFVSLNYPKPDGQIKETEKLQDFAYFQVTCEQILKTLTFLMRFDSLATMNLRRAMRADQRSLQL